MKKRQVPSVTFYYQFSNLWKLFCKSKKPNAWTIERLNCFSSAANNNVERKRFKPINLIKIIISNYRNTLIIYALLSISHSLIDLWKTNGTQCLSSLKKLKRFPRVRICWISVATQVGYPGGGRTAVLGQVDVYPNSLFTSLQNVPSNNNVKKFEKYTSAG